MRRLAPPIDLTVNMVERREDTMTGDREEDIQLQLHQIGRGENK